MARLEEYVIEDFLAACGRLPVVEEIVEQAGVDPSAIEEIEEALTATQADLDATDDADEAVKLIQRRKALRDRLAKLQDDATSGAVVRRVDTGLTFAEVWEATHDKEERRALLSRAYSEVRVKKGRRGRHGLDPERVIPLPAETFLEEDLD